jgi:type IV pilus assembly protein PilW
MKHDFPSGQRGLSLIELMISMVLGLLVVGGAIGVFLSNQQTYRATESLARVQENARVAFELMAREVREAAGNPCAANLPTANVLKSPSASWWSNWANGVVGYENGTLAGSAAGTDAIELMSGTSGGVTVVGHDKNSAQFKVNTPEHGIEDFDILMVCDYGQASIFQATNVNSSNVTIVHNTGTVESGPGNCTKGLGLPVPSPCTANGTYKEYGANSIVVKLHAAQWYLADNARGGRSLYRRTMRKGLVSNPEEVAEGIQDMQIEYLLSGASDYIVAAPGVNWTRVTAVRITLRVQGRDRVGTDGEVLTRDVSHVVNLRNRTS